ncbi:outer membrane lipoprotein-sorting protein [Dethiosulfatarculus sandiegensis]|uniref:Membrane protein n=1 Tax=Dethiosulfatarculus sandiegensis TaxID=1429043 RepID=A0A0D2JEP6_9BACT|nr:outer membrane lipoprotein-sorting protein [Dethiosulfatarculus sandiegensis]KIX14116.1 membrane protein [Dethiosulfatarculus sandiegensis]
MPRIVLMLLMLTLVSGGQVLAGAADDDARQKGRQIMRQVDSVDTSLDSTALSVMLIERGKLKLVRRMRHMTRKNEGEIKGERTLIRFMEPADVRDTSYLTWSYDDPERTDDMWLYLPSESLVRRISGGGKKGAFMRSDLANEDIEDRSVDDDIHTLIGNEKQHGVDCFVIESVPRPELKKDTNYSKRVQYIRKDIYLPCRVEYYDKRGKLLKIGTYGGFKEIDGIWTITKSIIETPRRKTRTLYQRQEVKYNQGLDDTLFLQSNLRR